MSADTSLTKRQRAIRDRLAPYSKQAILDILCRVGVADLDEMEAWACAIDLRDAATAAEPLEAECHRISRVVEGWQAKPPRQTKAHDQRVAAYSRVITRYNVLTDKCKRLKARLDELDAIIEPRRHAQEQREEQWRAAQDAIEADVAWVVATRLGRTCRVCGCTDDDCSACMERTGEPCHWVEPDLCSACADSPAESNPLDSIDSPEPTNP